MTLGTVATNYIDQVCAQLKSAEARAEFRQELTGHITESVLGLMESRNLSQADAETQTVVRMGSADTLAGDMNKVHRGGPALLLVLRTIFLTLTGVFGILCAVVFGVAYANGTPMQGIGLFTPAPMFVTSYGPFDLRPFFFLPLLVSVLLYVVPAIRIHSKKRRMMQRS